MKKREREREIAIQRETNRMRSEQRETKSMIIGRARES
jgi:hypothetical protein